MRFVPLVWTSSLLALVVVKVHCGDCSCKQVSSWEDLKSIIQEANTNETTSPQTLILCPFRIQKQIDENTNHWGEFLNIRKPMHIVCQKERPSDRCWVEVVGETCPFNQNCGRAMIKISSDDVTIDGLKITRARDNIIVVAVDKKRVRLIDIEIFGSNVPGNDSGAPTGLITINTRASVHILESVFAWNQASVVENKGSLVIHSSRLNDNRVRTQETQGGAIINKAGGNVVLISTSLYGNRAQVGPAIFSDNRLDVVDGGLNCASENTEFRTLNECNGVFDSTSGCMPLLGGDCSIDTN